MTSRVERGFKNSPDNSPIEDECGCHHSDFVFDYFTSKKVKLSNTILQGVCTISHCGCKFDVLTPKSERKAPSRKTEEIRPI
jgi:hypothetical protein